MKEFPFPKLTLKQNGSCLEKSFKTFKILQEHITFFKWFNQRKEFDHLCRIKENEYWKTQRGEINDDFPPMEDVKFKSFSNKNVIAKPFQIINEFEEHKTPTNKEIKSIQV